MFMRSKFNVDSGLYDYFTHFVTSLSSIQFSGDSSEATTAFFGKIGHGSIDPCAECTDPSVCTCSNLVFANACVPDDTPDI